MISKRCGICKNSAMRLMVEAGWNLKLTTVQIAQGFGGVPTSAAIYRHLKEHVEEGAQYREIPLSNATPMRQRIEALQIKMMDELELRTQHAEALASEDPDALASTYFDLLDKNNQAALATIIRMQDQVDKRESKKAEVAVDMYKLMAGTPPPAHLIGDGLGVEVVEGESKEVDDETPARPPTQAEWTIE